MDAFLFLTWRLAGSLLSGAGGFACQTARAGAAFFLADREADRADSGPLWLADPRIAGLVVDALHCGERERLFYKIRAYVVMPNHVHLLLHPQRPLPVITRWLKGSTARKANLILGRTGEPFWQEESYDHWVRNQDELEKTVRYIERNPVAAGLARSVEAWPWSSARWQAVSPALLAT